MIDLTCRCGAEYEVEQEYAGQSVECPACGAVLNIPDAAGASSPGPPPVPPPPSPSRPESEPASPRQDPPPPELEPILHATGKKKTMGNLALRGELKRAAGAQLLSSDVYQVGERRSWRQRLAASTMVGPIRSHDTEVDLLQVFHLQDDAGEFAMVLSFDNGMICPVEFVARLPGVTPASICLLKQSGGKIAMEAGAVLGGPLGKLLETVGTRVESVWAGCDGNVPDAALAAQEVDALREGIRWEGKTGGGPVKSLYRIGWGAQLLPLGDETLLVMQSVPRQKMMGFEFGLPWFQDMRHTFTDFLDELGATAPGPFTSLAPGLWLPVCHEVFGWL